MPKFESARIDKSFEPSEASKGASLDGPIEFVEKSKKELGGAAKITSLQEFVDYARVRELTQMTQAEGSKLQEEMLDTVFKSLTREDEKAMDEIIALLDRSEMDPEKKEELFESLADVLLFKSVENLDVSKVVNIIESSNLSAERKKELLIKLENLVDSLSLVTN